MSKLSDIIKAAERMTKGLPNLVKACDDWVELLTPEEGQKTFDAIAEDAKDPDGAISPIDIALAKMIEMNLGFAKTLRALAKGQLLQAKHIRQLAAWLEPPPIVDEPPSEFDFEGGDQQNEGA